MGFPIPQFITDNLPVKLQIRLGAAFEEIAGGCYWLVYKGNKHVLEAIRTDIKDACVYHIEGHKVVVSGLQGGNPQIIAIHSPWDVREQTIEFRDSQNLTNLES